MEVIARSVRGVEFVVADEIDALAASNIVLGSREVRFASGERQLPIDALRTPEDLFVTVGSVRGVSGTKQAVPGLVADALALDWRSAVAFVRSHRKVPDGFRFDVVASLLGGRNYSRYDVEDAIGRPLAELLGAEYCSRDHGETSVSDMDLTIRVFIEGEEARIAVRLERRPLHRRAYKQDVSRGSLHPSVAAILARLAEPQRGEVVLDPFCGDGTIVVETAIAFAGAVVHGSDLDPDRVRNARANAGRAEVEVDLNHGDAGRIPFPDGSIDAIVTNPPWNQMVKAGGTLANGFDRFWREARRVLSPSGRICVIMETDAPVDVLLESQGFALALTQNVRLAGRISQIAVATPVSGSDWVLPPGIAARRRQAIAAGLTTGSAF
jgi:tRNA (guanine6-N2)-methyltransferase